jgi:hypothetical protein
MAEKTMKSNLGEFLTNLMNKLSRKKKDAPVSIGKAKDDLREHNKKVDAVTKELEK